MSNALVNLTGKLDIYSPNHTKFAGRKLLTELLWLLDNPKASTVSIGPLLSENIKYYNELPELIDAVKVETTFDEWLVNYVTGTVISEEDRIQYYQTSATVNSTVPVEGWDKLTLEVKVGDSRENHTVHEVVTYAHPCKEKILTKFFTDRGIKVNEPEVVAGTLPSNYRTREVFQKIATLDAEHLTNYHIWISDTFMCIMKRTEDGIVLLHNGNELDPNSDELRYIALLQMALRFNRNLLNERVVAVTEIANAEQRIFPFLVDEHGPIVNKEDL